MFGGNADSTSRTARPVLPESVPGLWVHSSTTRLQRRTQNLDIAIDGADAWRDGDTISYILNGDADSWISAHVLGDDPEELRGFRDSQTDVWILGPIELTFSLSFEPVGETEQPDFDVAIERLVFEID